MKKKIFNNMKENDSAIVNYDNKEAYDLVQDINCIKYYFSKNNKQNVYLDNNSIYYKDEKIIDCKNIRIKGTHNYENAMAAIGVVKLYNVKNESIRKVLENFKGVEHRIEYVETIKGVSYYNDAKSTNNEATKIALNSFNEPTLLILGGLDRGQSFDELREDMTHVKYVACYGETKDKIKSFCDKINMECEVFDNLQQATKSCINKAVEGDVILLSPACASWDQYEKFEDRGNEFKDIIKKLKEDNL